MFPIGIKHRGLDKAKELREEGVCHIRPQIFSKIREPLQEGISYQLL